MIRRVLEKIGNKNTTKKLDSVLKLMKTNIDGKMPIKIKWGKPKSSIDNKGALSGGLNGEFVMQGQFNIKVTMMETLTNKEEDKIYIGFKFGMKTKSGFGKDFIVIEKNDLFTLNDAQRTKTAVVNATKVLSKAVKENERRQFVFEFDTKADIVKAVKSGKKVYYGDDTSVIWDSAEGDLMFFDRKHNSLTSFAGLNLENDIARCYTKDGK